MGGGGGEVTSCDGDVVSPNPSGRVSTRLPACLVRWLSRQRVKRDDVVSRPALTKPPRPFFFAVGKGRKIKSGVSDIFKSRS